MKISKSSRAFCSWKSILSLYAHDIRTRLRKSRWSARLENSIVGKAGNFSLGPSRVTREKRTFSRTWRFGKTIWRQNWTCRSSVIYWVSYYRLFRIKTFCGKLESLGIVCYSGICVAVVINGTPIAHVRFPDYNNNACYHGHAIIPRKYPRIAGDSHILFQPITALTAVGPNRSLASRQAIVWTYRPRVEATEPTSRFSQIDLGKRGQGARICAALRFQALDSSVSRQIERRERSLGVSRGPRLRGRVAGPRNNINRNIG